MMQLIENGRLALRLLQDSRVSTWIKVGIPLLVALYILTPIDLIPDFLVGPGELDDLGVVLLGLTLLIRLAPQDIVEEHREALGYAGSDSRPRSGGGFTARGQSPKSAGTGSSIEGEYRVLPTDQPVDNRTRKL